MKTIIDLEEELYDLKEYLPINTSNNFFIVMFSNLLVVKESDFYNNAVINLAHFYNYILHNLLVRLYNCNCNHLELLHYLQLTEACLNSNDGQKIDLPKDKKIDIYIYILLKTKKRMQSTTFSIY